METLNITFIDLFINLLLLFFIFRFKIVGNRSSKASMIIKLNIYLFIFSSSVVESIAQMTGGQRHIKVHVYHIHAAIELQNMVTVNIMLLVLTLRVVWKKSRQLLKDTHWKLALLLLSWHLFRLQFINRKKIQFLILINLIFYFKNFLFFFFTARWRTLCLLLGTINSPWIRDCVSWKKLSIIFTKKKKTKSNKI